MNGGRDKHCCGDGACHERPCPANARPGAAFACRPVKEAAEAGPSALVLEGYLWRRGDPAVHHGALCSSGRAVAFSGGAEVCSARRLAETGPARLGEVPGEMPYLCPECQERTSEAAVVTFEAPLAQVGCACSPLTVIYTGTDAEMAQAFEQLAGRGLIDLDADPTALLCHCHAAARGAALRHSVASTVSDQGPPMPPAVT